MPPEDMLCSREHDEESQVTRGRDAMPGLLQLGAIAEHEVHEVAGCSPHAREITEITLCEGADPPDLPSLTRCVSRDSSRTMLDSASTADDDSASSSLSNQLRAAILNAGCTRYSISKATGIDQATLSRFVNARSNSSSVGLSLKAVDKLAMHLNLELSPRCDFTN